MNKNQAYVYVILDQHKVPFYIGKGTGLRHKSTLYDCKNSPIKKHKIEKIKKITGSFPEVKILCYGSNKYCLEIEKKLIKFYGRKDTKTGILCNTTDGGEGGLGIIRSKETREKISKAFKGSNHWNFGKKASKEHKEKLRKAHIGIQSGEKHPLFGKEVKKETIEKRLKTIQSKIKYIITSPENIIYECNNLRKFCIENNLSSGTMNEVLHKKRKHYKGWKCDSVII